MNNTYSINRNITEAFNHIYQQCLQKTNLWRNHFVCIVSDISQRMQQNPHFAIGVIATTNAIFFSFVYVLIDRLNKDIENQEQLNDKQRIFKHVLLDGALTGGSIFVFNVLFSKLMKYSLSQAVITTIATTAIVARVLLNSSTDNKKIIKNQNSHKHLKANQKKSKINRELITKQKLELKAKQEKEIKQKQEQALKAQQDKLKKEKELKAQQEKEIKQKQEQTLKAQQDKLKKEKELKAQQEKEIKQKQEQALKAQQDKLKKEKEAEIEVQQDELEKEPEIEVQQDELEKEAEIEVQQDELEKEAEIEVQQDELEKGTEIEIQQGELEKEPELEVQQDEPETKQNQDPKLEHDQGKLIDPEKVQQLDQGLSSTTNNSNFKFTFNPLKFKGFNFNKFSIMGINTFIYSSAIGLNLNHSKIKSTLSVVEPRKALPPSNKQNSEI